MKKMLHENELINIEEDMILQPGYLLRRFTLKNRISGLSVSIVNSGAAVRNIRLDGLGEIVRLFGGNNLIDWNPHVLGLDTLLLNAGANKLMYQLTPRNELIAIGTFRSHQQHMDIVAPFYFNLNPDFDSLDEHLLHVKTQSADPESDQLPVLNTINDQLFDLTGSEPCKLERCDELLINNHEVSYTATGDKSTLLIVTLSYGESCVEVTIKNNSQALSMENSVNNPVTCRVRLRIRQNGISIMPYMMTEFHCVYKFSWPTA